MANIVEILKNNSEMELCYLWVGKYKLINEEGFNFSGKYRFNATFEKNKLIVEIKENEDFIKNFFGSNITNITAIVGKNGTGKSTVLNYIKNNIFDFVSNKVVIFRIGFKFIGLYSNIEEPICSQYNITWYKWDKDKYQALMNNTRGIISEIGQLNVLFYSNLIYNAEESEREYPEYIVQNISTLNLMKQNKYFSGDKSTQIQKIFLMDIIQSIIMLDNKKIRNHIDDIIVPNLRYLKISISDLYKDAENRPTGIILTSKPFNDYYGITQADNLLIDKSRTALIQGLKNVEESIYTIEELSKENTRDMLIFKIKTYKNILVSLFNEYFYMNNRVIYFLEFLRSYTVDEDITYQNFSDIFIDFLESLYKSYTSILRKKKYDLMPAEIKENKKILLSYLFIARYLHKNKLNLHTMGDSSSYILDIQNNIKPMIIFIKKYMNLPSLRFYDFNFIQEKNSSRRIISSGEEAMLKIYSRLYWAITNMETNSFIKINKKTSHILILMDEPEIYLHPAWQTQLIDRLIEFLGNVYKDYSIQLIISSNTPFLVSDLPSHNVIFMEKDEENCKVKKDQLIPTFGQNIHTLFKEAFFMEKGTIGKFAKGKINDVIRDLDQLDKPNNQISEARIKEIYKIINYIGEPIVKGKLLQVLEDKTKHNKEARKQYLLRIKEEIEEELSELD
ncbi:AAA family ATPase [Alkaliphilus transvaalensis]|uniref:AAA family ATPase n=1 Tax=Alkaliphilus transvaalensis TaxID=114628 RepID=UPI0006857300|nr:AAA family ATPase [Alkaliphilus transvaalensis]